jgi:hypothetical protein
MIIIFMEILMDQAIRWMSTRSLKTMCLAGVISCTDKLRHEDVECPLEHLFDLSDSLESIRI